ncbi:MAG: hypothetical protein NVV70_00400 [Cellulomonas sp.]|uniref:Htaa domain-containing protein n=1 Tax=Cellulomonas gelida TaxID=1712 RepID=A0A4Y3KG06_9CELL|nr:MULTISPECIES: hypothetical protein [Cellulomonas]MCR6646672.1 hypothetical protein [Cellulomonas sp.]MCR6705911.1 hypothetical protein [Cellulomonas sp.]GEA83339.1 hypothetical protein CGE01nite_05900 [Cellulomonas gelida]GGL13714.1 hypothetical protein GCM10009774_00520 [Cellulomonas gelida]
MTHPTTSTTVRTRRRAPLVASLLAATLGLGVLGLAAAPASAAARVTVAAENGKAQADATYSTPVRVSGSGFQSVPGGFGGIYVVFGWVDDPAGGSWRPSKGGVSGQDLLYVPDSESKDNAGFQRFVSYPGSDTASSANGGTIAADGTWSTTLTIPGPKVEVVGRSGAVTSIDCLTVTCGVITFGAHGVSNATNETFTPVQFVDLADAQGAAAGDDDEAAQPGAEATAVATPATGGAASPQVDGPAEATSDQSTVVRGRVLSFTARGFAAGEQVVGSLTGGQAGVGPLTAGPYGEVAGVLAVPAALTPGTATLTLTGAASGQVATLDVTVIEDPVVAAALANAGEQPGAGPSAATWVLVGVAALLVALVVLGALAARRRRRAAERGTPAAPGESDDEREAAPELAGATR